MKKLKNIELKETKPSLEHAKQSIVKKNKQKKKLKNVVAKTEPLNLAPEIELKNNVADIIKKKNKKKKSAKQEDNQVFTEEPPKVANDKNKTEQQKKIENKCKNNEEENPQVQDAELNKIEKKKAKKLAQKLKKKQNKLENKVQNKIPHAATANGLKQDKNVDATSSKVLNKKEKKAKNRQLIKDQQLAKKQDRNPAVAAATVFVGNLPVNTKRPQLIHLFKDFAPVNFIRMRSACGKVLYTHAQRKSAGSLNAYVELKDKETAEKALSLNGVEFKGHHLRVTLASNKSQSNEKDVKKTIFVGNLKYSATEESLREIFSSCGEIDYVRCLRDGDKGCNGVAYVCFKTADAVGLALELNKTVVDERPINVERFSGKKLGAKKAREDQAKKEEKSKKGAKKRLDNKKDKVNKSGSNKQLAAEVDDAKKPKKSEFRGVKVEGLKKKQKSKKKKSNDQMLQLAKKIAPKPKSE